jgi:hypothetical protein
MASWKIGTAIRDLPGRLPPDNVPRDVELSHFPARAGSTLLNLTQRKLTSSALWLDMCAKTHHLKTHSKDVAGAWRNSKQIYDIKASSARLIRLQGTSWVQVSHSFKVKHQQLTGRGSGIVGFTLDENSKEWRVFMLTTVLEYYEGHGNPDIPMNATDGELRTYITRWALVSGADTD